MFRRLLDWLALTRTERNVILFVTGVFLAGLAIRLYQETFPSRVARTYEHADSTFIALADAAKNERSPQPDRGVLDINTATREELISLPGIGGVTADRILLYRKESGPFRTIDDLRKIRGISARKLEQLKPLVSVTGTHP